MDSRPRGGWRRAAVFGLAAPLLTALLAWPAQADLAPGRLLIYYGWPSALNGGPDGAAVAAELARYDYVVLGDGLASAAHPDHGATVAILSAVHAVAPTRIFGYIDLGLSTQGLSLVEIELRVDQWLATGADGIFLDDFGYDFGVTRARQNAAVDLVHQRGRGVVANGWNPDDLFASQVHPQYNPTGLATSLGADDFYLSESFQYGVGAYQDESAWYAKAATVAVHQAALGFGVLSVTTNDATNAYDPAAFAYAWYSALLCGHEATGWGEHQFAAVSCNAPWRGIPPVAPGSAFTTGIQAASPFYRRTTDAGRVVVDAAAHSGRFEPGATGVAPGRQAPGLTVTCAPNPFNPATVISFELPDAACVTAGLYALDGRRAALLVDRAVLPAGPHRVRLDGGNLPSGRYLCRVEAGGATATTAVTLIR